MNAYARLFGEVAFVYPKIERVRDELWLDENHKQVAYELALTACIVLNMLLSELDRINKLAEQEI